MSDKGYIAVDLDATLARYDGWKPDGGIGEPIQPMVNRVKAWIADGKTVKIMTARVAATGRVSAESNLADTQEFCNGQARLIEEWCLKHIGCKLEVTASKCFSMVSLWDDRCVQVIKNKGIPVTQAAEDYVALLEERIRELEAGARVDADEIAQLKRALLGTSK